MKIRKTTKGKIFLSILLVLFFCFFPTFAADLVSCSGESSGLATFAIVLRWIINVFSRLWIILAKLAGVLMTNTLLYGQFVNLDVVLWNVWQIVRTFTNYAIGLLFLFYIIRYFFDQSVSPTKIIKELLLTSVFVQASWFLTMAVIDISTLCLATVSSFPSQVIASSSKIQYKFVTDLKQDYFLKYGLDTKKGIVINTNIDDYTNDGKQSLVEIVDVTPSGEGNGTEGTDEQEKKLMDYLQPSMESLDGPLMYFGFTLFQINNDAALNNVKGENCVELFTKITINNIINAGAMVLYTIALCVLVFILIIRVMSIWIFIAISPFACLVYFGESLLPSKLKPSDGGTIGHCFQINKMLKLIFQPVIFGLYISIMFLFIIVLKTFLSSDPLGTVGNGEISITEKTGQTPNTKTSTLNIGKVQDGNDPDGKGVIKMVVLQGTKSLTEIIIALIALALMWQLVRLAITSDTGISSLNTMTKNISNTMNKAIGDIGIIPTPAGSIGWNQLTGANNKTGLVSGYTNKITGSVNDSEIARENALRERLGITNHAASQISKNDINDLSSKTKLGDFSTSIQAIKNKNGSIDFFDAMNHFSEFVNKNWDKRSTNGINDFFDTGDSIIAGNTSPLLVSEGQDQEEVFKSFFNSTTQYGQSRLRNFYVKILGVKDEPGKRPESYDKIKSYPQQFKVIGPDK